MKHTPDFSRVNRRTSQQLFIQGFVAAFNTCKGTSYRMRRWPDEENRESEDIDAIAEASGLPDLAIEHTEIHAWSNRKALDHRFDQVITPQEAHFPAGKWPSSILIVDKDAIQPGVNWNEVAENLRKWLCNNLSKLPQGRSTYVAPGVPFAFTIDREDGMRGLTVARWAPPRGEIQLKQDIYRAFDRKKRKLCEYKQRGARTILLLESQDIALTSPPSIKNALSELLNECELEGIDEVWLGRVIEGEASYYFLWSLVDQPPVRRDVS